MRPLTEKLFCGHRFVFLPMLYELVTGELKDWEVAPVFSDLLKETGVKFLQGKVRADCIMYLLTMACFRP